MAKGQSQNLNIDELLETAALLKDENKALQKRTMKNRQILRLLADNGVLDEDATAFVNETYPVKIKGVRTMGKNGKKLDRPVYSDTGEELSDEDLAIVEAGGQIRE